MNNNHIKYPQFSQPETIDSIEVSCGLCGSHDSRFYAESYDFEMETCRNAWKFVQCSQCSNVYLNPRPAPSEAHKIYPKYYYAYQYQDQINPMALKIKAWMDQQLFKTLIKKIGFFPKTYLDIGCGNGRYLRQMHQMGLAKEKIYGIELDEKIAAPLSAEGYQVSACPFEKATHLPENYFDLITLFSVLEHLESPYHALEQIRKLLRPGGVVAFEVPNIDSLNAKLFQDYFWGGYHTPRHWNLFGLNAIRKVSEKLGLELVALKRTTGHAFWPWSLHHLFIYRFGWKNIGRKLSPFKCLPLVGFFTVIDMIRGACGMQTDNFIVFLRKPSV